MCAIYWAMASPTSLRNAASLLVDRFIDGAAFRDYFKAHYGPTISAYRGIAGEPDRVAALDAELAGLGDRYWPARRRWSGSTCWSPRASADQPAGAKRGAPPGPGSGRASTRMPHVTESGSQSTIFAATRSPLCSSSSTSAITYGVGNLRVERVVVDRVGEYRAMTGHRLRDQRTAAVAAFAGGGMDPACAVVAVRDEQLGRRLSRHGQYSTLNSLELVCSGLV